MSRISPKLNTKELFEKLQSALEDDKRYWIRNDAKLKAVVTSKSYDEFREIVDAAHLKPLSRKEIVKNKRTWNAVAKPKSNE